MKKAFWDKFYEKPLNKIPWQNTQADWFKELVDGKIIKGASAIDLGCGTGKKSIYLAKNGDFKKVIGIDIAEKAIDLAKQSAIAEKVEDVCAFIAHDATDWSFIESGEKFDFILDWANLHGIPIEKRNEYVKGIHDHSHRGTLFLIRTFSTETDDEYFEEKIDSIKEKVYLFNENSIASLFPGFKIIKKHKSLPRTKPNLYFTELLMEKIL